MVMIQDGVAVLRCVMPMSRAVRRKRKTRESSLHVLIALSAGHFILIQLVDYSAVGFMLWFNYSELDSPLVLPFWYLWRRLPFKCALLVNFIDYSSKKCRHVCFISCLACFLFRERCVILGGRKRGLGSSNLIFYRTQNRTLVLKWSQQSGFSLMYIFFYFPTTLFEKKRLETKVESSAKNIFNTLPLKFYCAVELIKKNCLIESYVSWIDTLLGIVCLQLQYTDMEDLKPGPGLLKAYFKPYSWCGIIF